MDIGFVDLYLKVGAVWKQLELDSSVSISFTMQMRDLTNPTVQLNDYSTQVSVPRTPENDAVFGHIYRKDHFVSGGFNPLFRSDFQLYVSGSLYQTGYVRLEQVDDKGYHIRLYGGLGDFFRMLDDVLLRDLDFGGLFDHVIDRYLIANCFNGVCVKGTYEDYALGGTMSNDDVLTYVMAYRGQYDDFDSDSETGYDSENGNVWSEIEVTWVDKTTGKRYASPVLDEHRRVSDSGFGEYRSYYQSPALRLKVVFNRIVAMAQASGWTLHLDPSFFSVHNPYWDRLWMVFPRLDVSVSENMSGDIFVGSGDGSDWVQGGMPFISDPVHSTSVNFMVPTGARSIAANDTYGLKGVVRFMVYAETPAPPVRDAVYKRGYLEVLIEVLVGVDVVSSSRQRFFESDLMVKAPGFFTDSSGGDFYYSVPDYSSVDADRTSQKGSVYTVNFSDRFSTVGKGSSASVSVRITLSGDSWFYYYDDHAATFPNDPVPPTDAMYGARIRVLADSYLNISDLASSGIRSGAKVGYQSIVRSDETCFDFLTGYCKIFGLYFVKDDFLKTVELVTRNTFYGGKETVDWTHRVDYSEGTELQPVPFTYRKGVFKWKHGETKYERKYLNGTGREYGSLVFDTGNEFGSEKEEYLEGLIFGNGIVATEHSPYFLGRGGSGIDIYKDNKALPAMMDSENEGAVSGSAGISLFFKGRVKKLPERYAITDDDPIMQEQGFCWNSSDGKFLATDGYTPFLRTVSIDGDVYSLNFGRPSVTYNDDEAKLIAPDSTDGDETIYARFWKAYIHDVFNQNHKVLTCRVLLTLSDLHSGLFGKFIFIDHTVWVLDKIHQFNPLSKAPTKVTLVKVQDMKSYADGQRIFVSPERVPTVLGFEVEHLK